MVERLRVKPGAERIAVTVCDFATTRLDRRFRLAFLVFNTITNLTSQDAQVACFRTVADHLEPGGSFLVEVGVPDLCRLPPGQSTRVFAMEPTHIEPFTSDSAMHVSVWGKPEEGGDGFGARARRIGRTLRRSKPLIGYIESIELDDDGALRRVTGQRCPPS
jgi:hypothetical protein